MAKRQLARKFRSERTCQMYQMTNSNMANTKISVSKNTGCMMYLLQTNAWISQGVADVGEN
jgi:hypothetical protein